MRQTLKIFLYNNYIMTHKSEDYKISAVKYYINNNKSLDEVCEIFECSRKSLYRWFKNIMKLTH